MRSNVVVKYKQTPHRRAIAREAQRRLRQREKKCQAVAKSVDHDDRVLSMLIRRRYLDENEIENVRAVGAAIALFMADAAADDL